MEWNVIRWDNNELVLYNVFNHRHFIEDAHTCFNKAKSKEEFSKLLDKEAMYYFWGKAEHEVMISPLFSDKRKKVDVYWQLKANWENFVDCIWKKFMLERKANKIGGM